MDRRPFARGRRPSDALDTASLLPEPFVRWFAHRGWTPREHQLELLAKARAGRSVLLIAPTGGGKTLAGFLPGPVGGSPAPPANWFAPPPVPGGGVGRGQAGSVLQ